MPACMTRAAIAHIHALSLTAGASRCSRIVVTLNASQLRAFGRQYIVQNEAIQRGRRGQEDSMAGNPRSETLAFPFSDLTNSVELAGPAVIVFDMFRIQNGAQPCKKHSGICGSVVWDR